MKHSHLSQIALRTAFFTAGFTFTAAGADFPPPLRIPDGLGVNIHFTQPQAGEMEMLAGAGFKWVRMDFIWSDTEKAKGHYDFSAYERLLEQCDQHHLRLMAILDYSNPLYDQNLSPYSDEGIAAFASWAVAAVTHFKNRHILWEMYNEPNGFWRPHPDVNAYIKLALAVGKAVKAAAPEELHCGPGLSGTDAAWLEPCYKAGLLQYWDAVSVHPYGDEPPETRQAHYRGVRALLDRYQPKGKSIPILSGEWGYTAARVSRDTQGKFLAREILFNLYSGIPLSIWYDWRDDGPDPKEGEHNFGTVANPYHKDHQPVLDPKPAYLAAHTLNSQLDGFSFSRRVPLPDTNDFLLVFAKKREFRSVAWSISTNAHVVTLPASRGIISAVGHTGEMLPNLRLQANGVALELADGPKYLKLDTGEDPWK